VDPIAEPTHAHQVMRPFTRLLRTYPQIPDEALDELAAADPTQRTPMRISQELLAGAVVLTGDENLGLRAALQVEVGDFEVFEYVSASAATLRDGIETLFRYTRLMNEAADFRLEERDGRARVILHSTVPLGRAGADFQVAAFHTSLARRRPEHRASDMRVAFRHARPADASMYDEVFGDTEVRFDAEFDGLECDAELLQESVQTADAALHSVLRGHVDKLLSALDDDGGWAQRVRADITEHLTNERPSADRTASRLAASRRTLTRRLREENTSFTELLGDVRRRTAEHYLLETDHSVEDIAFLLGYSESAPFVRAFKRWTGRSPLEHRRQQSDRSG